jgi:hypothetical protein
MKLTEPLMVYFGPLTESGHFMFYETGEKVLYRDGNALCPWPYNEIDGTLQPGHPEPGDRLQRRTRQMREGEALLHHKEGWTALSFWDFTVDKRPGCSSTYLAKGTFTFEQMVELAKARFSERWSKMRFEVTDVTSDSRNT